MRCMAELHCSCNTLLAVDNAFLVDGEEVARPLRCKEYKSDSIVREKTEKLTEDPTPRRKLVVRVAKHGILE